MPPPGTTEKSSVASGDQVTIEIIRRDGGYEEDGNLHRCGRPEAVAVNEEKKKNSGGSFPFGKSGDSPFYFPDREKNVKIFPIREIK